MNADTIIMLGDLIEVTLVSSFAPGSRIICSSVGSLQTRLIFDITLDRHNMTWIESLHAYMRQTTDDGTTISWTSIRSNMRTYLKKTRNKTPSKAEIVIYVTPSNTNLLIGDRMKLNNKKAYLFIVGNDIHTTNLNEWARLATDNEHVFHSPGVDTELFRSLLERDSRMLCGTDEVMSELGRGCFPCSSVCSTTGVLTRQQPACNSECFYFMQKYLSTTETGTPTVTASTSQKPSTKHQTGEQHVPEHQTTSHGIAEHQSTEHQIIERATQLNGPHSDNPIEDSSTNTSRTKGFMYTAYLIIGIVVVTGCAMLGPPIYFKNCYKKRRKWLRRFWSSNKPTSQEDVCMTTLDDAHTPLCTPGISTGAIEEEPSAEEPSSSMIIDGNMDVPDPDDSLGNIIDTAYTIESSDSESSDTIDDNTTDDQNNTAADLTTVVSREPLTVDSQDVYQPEEATTRSTATDEVTDKCPIQEGVYDAGCQAISFKNVQELMAASHLDDNDKFEDVQTRREAHTLTEQ